MLTRWEVQDGSIPCLLQSRLNNFLKRGLVVRSCYEGRAIDVQLESRQCGHCPGGRRVGDEYIVDDDGLRCAHVSENVRLVGYRPCVANRNQHDARRSAKFEGWSRIPGNADECVIVHDQWASVIFTEIYMSTVPSI